MKRKLSLSCVIFLLLFNSCDWFDELTNSVSGSSNLSNDEIVSGLREALVVGARTAAFTLGDTSGQVNSLNEMTGYLANELVRIALPPDAEKAFNTVTRLSGTTAGSAILAFAGVDLSSYRQAMITGLNRGAEHAASLSVDVFKSAITGMTFTSASNILFGSDSLGATNYLESTTSAVLTDGFKPIISSSFNAVRVSAFSREYTVSSIWSEFAVNFNKVAEAYHSLEITASSGNIISAAAAKVSLDAINKTGVSTVDSLNTDIVSFATGKALDGLFYMVGKQELKIRRDPLAALTAIADAGEFLTQTISDLIKKVFTASGE